jgi:serine protease Do/serine protease DegQ
VAEGSPADKGGLKQGDVIVGVNGRPVTNGFDVRNQIGLTRAGERMTMDVIREGNRKQVGVVVGERSDATALPSGGAEQPGKPQPTARNPVLAGATFSDIPDGVPEYRGEQGAFVADVERGSRPWRSGLRPGDLITSVDRQPVRDVEDFLRKIDGKARQLLVGVRRGNGAAFMVLK